MPEELGVGFLHETGGLLYLEYICASAIYQPIGMDTCGITPRRWRRARANFAGSSIEGAPIARRINAMQHLPPVWNKFSYIQMPRMPQGNCGPSDREEGLPRS